jgi:hypothetical protein
MSQSHPQTTAYCGSRPASNDGLCPIFLSIESSRSLVLSVTARLVSSLARSRQTLYLFVLMVLVIILFIASFEECFQAIESPTIDDGDPNRTGKVQTDANETFHTTRFSNNHRLSPCLQTSIDFSQKTGISNSADH